MDPSDLDYSVESEIVGDMRIADRFTKNLKHTLEEINTHITYAYSPEYLVAKSLHKQGITEADFFNMRDKLNVDYPTIVKIANCLRDLWRKENAKKT